MKNKLRMVIVAGLATSFSLGACIAQDGSTCVKNLRATYDQTDGFSLNIKAEETISRSSDGAKQFKVRLIVVRKGGGRWSILARQTGDAWLAGKTRESSDCQEFVMDGSQAIAIKGQGRNYQRRYPEVDTVPLPDDKKEMYLWGSLDSSSPIASLNPRDYLADGQFLLGHIDAWTSLPDILDGASRWKT